MAGITFSFNSELSKSIFGLSQAPIRSLIKHRAEAFEQMSMLDKIYNKTTSKHAMEKYTSMTEMNGPMPVGEGGEYPQDSIQEGYDKVLEHMVWRDQFSITREAVDDGRLVDLKKKPQSFVRGFYRIKEDFGANMLGGAIGESKITYRGRSFDTTGADGKPFFCKEHPSFKNPKKTQSNLFAGAPSAENLGLLETHMQNFTGENGEVLAVAPKTIIIPNDSTLKKQVLEAIGSDKDPETGNNGYNYQYGRWNVIIWPYLNFLVKGDNKPWILMDPDYNEEYDCAILQQRVKLEVKSDFDAGHKNNIWYGYERYGIGFNDWRGFAVGGISGGTAL